MTSAQFVTRTEPHRTGQARANTPRAMGIDRIFSQDASITTELNGEPIIITGYTRRRFKLTATPLQPVVATMGIVHPIDKKGTK